MRANKKENANSNSFSKRNLDLFTKNYGLDYEVDLSIDPLALDLEWVGQPNLFMQYSSALAIARKEKDEAKRNLLQTRSSVRRELIKVNGKCTEAMVEEELSETDEWNEYIEACYQEDVLDGAVKAMQQRKVSLENMVELLKMQYFAAPKEPRDFSDRKTQSQVRSKIAKSLNKEEE